MLIIKIDKTDGDSLSTKILRSGLVQNIAGLFYNGKISTIDDSKHTELITTSEADIIDGTASIELTFRKTIKISKEDLNDRQSIDRVISEVKDFCEQSSKINNYSYLPLNMRTKKDATERAGLTRNGG